MNALGHAIMRKLIPSILIVAVIGLVCLNVAAQPAANDCADAKAQLTRAETKLNDWPALSRYREANTKLAERLKPEQRVVFMGDSITDSWDDPKYGGFVPGHSYIDRGISGQTTPQML